MFGVSHLGLGVSHFRVRGFAFQGSVFSRFGVFRDSRFWVFDVWFMVSGFRFGLLRSGFEVFEVSRYGFRISTLGLRVSRSGFPVLVLWFSGFVNFLFRALGSTCSGFHV